MPVLLRWLLRLGPTNPIAVRLVQSASRRGKHNLVRSAYLAVLIVVLLWMLLVRAGGAGGPPGYQQLAAAGAESFVVIAYLQIGLICILAPVFMASAIAQEANPRTWDIVLTTPLAPGQIVLGNLIGRLFFVIGLLLASLPLFALTQFFGGVPGTAIFASYAVAAAAALLVGSIAIALSVSRLVGRRAVFAFYVAVVSYLAATAAVDALLTSRSLGAGPLGNGVTYFTGLNPFLTLRALLNPSTYPRAEAGTYEGLSALLLESPVTAWVAGSSALSALLIIASTLTVRAGGLQTVVRGRSAVPWYRRMMGLGAQGSEHRPPRSVWSNPIAWREASARNSTFGKIVARWSFVVVGILAGVGLTVAHATGSFAGPGGDATFRLVLISVLWTEAAVITLVAINMAATAVSREREDGTLDLLLTTPITPGAYLGGKLRGLVAYLLPLIAVPVTTVGVAGAYALIFNRTVAESTAVTSYLVIPEAGLIAALVLVPFAAFCVMIGLQWSLKSKGTIGSVVATVAVVAIVAGTVGLCAWQSAGAFAYVGPALAGLSPAAAIFALVEPYRAMQETVDAGGGGMTGARIALLIGSGFGVAVFAAVIYGIHASMVRGFDFTVRKLAGIK